MAQESKLDAFKTFNIALILAVDQGISLGLVFLKPPRFSLLRLLFPCK